jgi:predicted RNase H-like HicB family nuclease
MKRYIYPAVVLVCEEGGYFAKFPDLPGCMTQGETVEEIFRMMRDALEGYLHVCLSLGEEIPEPSRPEHVKIEDEDGLGGFVTLVEAWIYDGDGERNKTVRMNVSLPLWMKEYGQEEGLNFSQILQNGICRQLHIDKDGFRRITPPDDRP